MRINWNAGFSLMLKGKKNYEEFSDINFLMLGKQNVNFNCGKLKWSLNRIGFQYRN